MSGLQTVDLAVLSVYLVAVLAVGMGLVRRVNSVAEYFMPRRFGKAMMVTHAFSTGTAADQAVTVASATFTYGLSGIWYQWLWLFATPFYWLIAPVMRRFRATTTADVLSLRFSPSVAMLFALVGILNMTVKIGVLLKGSGALVEAGTGGSINGKLAMALVTLIFVIYGTAGGLGTVIVVDFFQGILTVLFSVMLLPFVMHAVGGLEGIRHAVPRASMMSLVAPGEIGLFYVVMLSLQSLVGIIGQPFVMGVCGAGRTEMDGRFGFMVGNFVKRLCTIAWCLTALAGVAWYVQQGVDLAKLKPDNLYGDIAQAFLPRVLPGLLGVFLAAILACVMNSCVAYMIAGAGLWTANLYRPAVPGKSARHYINAGRLAGLAIVAGGLAFAYWVPNVVKALEIWLRIGPVMGIAFWMGILWRRTTTAGAWAASLAAFGMWLLSTVPAFVRFVERFLLGQTLGFVWREGGQSEIYEPWGIALYLAAGLLAGLVVSLATGPAPAEKLARFYGLIRTPITPGERVEEPCTLPPGVIPPPPQRLVHFAGLEIPMPSRVSVAGFLAGWLGVAALIGGFVLLVRS